MADFLSGKEILQRAYDILSTKHSGGEIDLQSNTYAIAGIDGDICGDRYSHLFFKNSKLLALNKRYANLGPKSAAVCFGTNTDCSSSHDVSAGLVVMLLYQQEQMFHEEIQKRMLSQDFCAHVFSQNDGTITFRQSLHGKAIENIWKKELSSLIIQKPEYEVLFSGRHGDFVALKQPAQYTPQATNHLVQAIEQIFIKEI